MTPEQKLRELGLELPPPPRPVGAYVPAVRTGNLVFTAGQVPMRDGRLMAAGKVPAEVSLPDAQAAARQCVLNALAAVLGALGESPAGELATLGRVARVVRLNVFVCSAAGFTEQAKVANGASELLLELFGDSGRHSRCAIGAAELPLGAAVELDLVVEVT